MWINGPLVVLNTGNKVSQGLLISNFCCPLITFLNSLDPVPDQDRQNVGPDLDPSH